MLILNRNVELAVSTYHYMTPVLPYISLRKKGFLLVELLAPGGMIIPGLEDFIFQIVLSDGEGSNERNLYYCRAEDALSLQNDTDTPQTVSFTDDVCTMEIELPKGASAEYKDYQLTASCPEGETMAGTYTSVEGEELIDISFSGSASENAKFDFSGEELIISGQPELRIDANYKNYNLSGNSTSELTDENASLSFDPKGTLNNSADDPHYSYTGKAVEPALTVKAGDTVLTKEVDYTVSYSDNIKPGTAKVTINGIGSYTGTITKTFLILPGKTTRGDMFNLANNVKVTWKEVPGAKYYKVYREGVTDKKETRKDPVIVTTGLVGWDKDPGLTNGHAYRYKIVASLTGKGDSSGDSYVLQYCERKDMVGAKTKVVLGASNTSYVIGGLKKGKTYYISIRVRKKVNGIDYYTTFGVPKQVTVTK